MKPLRELAGRRFEYVDGHAPDLTVIAGDPATQTVRLHSADGQRQTVPEALFVRALQQGVLVESRKLGFVNPGDEPSGQRVSRGKGRR